MTAPLVSAPLAVADFEERARNVLDAASWDWLAGGAERERTLRANRAELDRIALVPRVLADVSACDTSATFLARRCALPVSVAPVAYQRLFHPEGERAAARAAAAAGVPYVVSTLTSTPLAELAATDAELWFQLYWLKDRNQVLRLVRAAEEAGARALVVTVDVPVMGRRLRDARGSFALPPSVRAVLLDESSPPLAHRRAPGASAVAVHTSAAFSQSVTWADLRWLRQRTELPLVVKGVLDPDDAVLAAESGAAAVVVSNHGGRQLDGAVPTALALPRVVERLGSLGADQCEVLVDSGVRGGADVLALLALGARAVLLGRPMIWGLAAGGEQGCRHVLDLLGAELHHAMQLAGCPTVGEAHCLRTTRLCEGNL